MERLRVAGREYLVTESAARRLALRRISREELAGVLGRPTNVEASRGEARRWICRRTLEGRRLAVVVEGIPGLAPWDIVTAWVENEDG